MGLFVNLGQFSIRNPTYFSRTFWSKTSLTVVYNILIPMSCHLTSKTLIQKCDLKMVYGIVNHEQHCRQASSAGVDGIEQALESVCAKVYRMS